MKANILMLIASLIWGTAFVSQTTGMGFIGPFTFSFARFFLAALTVLPLALYFEKQNFEIFFKNKNFIYLSLFAGLALFGGMGLQQYALLKSQIANASFLSTLYVPIVSLISRFIFKSRLHWIVWIAVLLCIYGSYLLSANQALEIQRSDSLLFIAAVCFAIHIILIDVFMKQFYSPFTFGFIQYAVVFLCSTILAFSFETPTLANIKLEWFELIYTGVASAGIGYTLQIIAQSKASPAPAAIILSMESVFGTIAGWILINQVLDTNKILGCIAIFIGVIIVQLIPIYTNKK
ncbi:DMT family transporter [Alphaproteobacteria bacterium]|nr:DMT family transporter [Alphaproteobacteria bacterium]MDC0191934.1 DMT family transporter [Alphaproteobacteria bacterium]|tara:strand:+ start:1661 stop:2536 length:876 start_codon:yes stop_codon:yes gene_type:complete